VSYAGSYRAGAIAGTDEDLRTVVEPVWARGEGYLEMSRPGSEYPALLIGFRDDHAVIHFQETAEVMYQLHGDSSVSAAQEVEVVILGEVMTFPGDCAIARERALQVMGEFARTGSVDTHPRWRM
jgi:hypothetical protein